MLLQVEQLAVSYGALRVVHEVSLEVSEGEIVGLIGPNAAGKTTSLFAIAGALKPDQGRVTLDGKDITGRSPEDIVRAGLAVVPEGRRILSSLTVEENLRLGGISRTKTQELHEEIEHAFERFPRIAEHRHSKAGHLSGGEQQLLAIARALMAKPRLLLVDEASLGLSPIAVEAVFAALLEFRSADRAVVVVEHDVERISTIADRIYAVSEGRSRYLGARGEIDREDIEAIYLGRRPEMEEATTVGGQP
ncbi:MAG TPA: ABC transporter ATP-binding protein [Solirubrobacteraceae bacterium]|jgi:branched-chain amino acid transport system ATP-binding protein